MTQIAAPQIDFGVVAPLAALVATGLLILLVDLVTRRATRRMLYSIGIAGSLVSLVRVALQVGHPATTFVGAFASDRFSWAFDAIILVALIGSLLLSLVRDAEDGASPAAYSSLLVFCALGGMIMAGAANLIVIFLGIEQLSLALYILTGTGLGRPASQEAALKYVLLGSLASGFLIYGSALLYGASGSVALTDIAHAAASPSMLFITGFTLFIVGVGFKLALAPFHVWTPDVYEGAPIAVTAFMAVAVKAATFSVLARFVYVVFGHDVPALAPLWAIAILSMIVGNVGAIAQTNLKRLLAYSSIAQAGYIVLALAGVTGSGLSAMVFYLAAYAFMNLGAFAVIALVGDGSESVADIASYRGLFWRRPWVAVCMTVFMFSLAGIPATAGFIGKVLLLGQAVAAGPWGIAMAVVLVFGTLVSFYVYLKVVWAMFSPLEDGASAPAGNALVPWIAVAAGVAGVVLMGVLPQLFYSLFAT
ncbi:MAG TPA: NADH-quinone oxidoreductase subunit N [Candidatus Eremiobacteraceae bacterium]|nr:NADH-quinone oxidoreductase subunit N [Candidatus Eremiobacteraceae bacterium]